MQRPRAAVAPHEFLRPLGDDDLVQIAQLGAPAQVNFRRVDALQAQQTVHQMGFGVLVGEIEHILIRAQGDIARDLQRRNRLADALRAAQQNQFGFAQPAADKAIQRIEAGRQRNVIDQIAAHDALIGFVEHLRQGARQMRIATRAICGMEPSGGRRTGELTYSPVQDSPLVRPVLRGYP